MSQPHDPYRRLETTRHTPSESLGPAEMPEGPDPRFWGEPGPRTAHRRGLGRGRGVDGPLDRLRDRVSDALSALRGDARVGLAVLVAVAVVAGVVWYRVGSGGAATAQRSAPSRAGSRAPSGGSGTEPSGAGPTSDPAQAVSGSGAPSPKGNRVVVHVAGAVARPGVVELASGSRVIDAVEAAGGGLPEADLDRLNLAAKIVDGQRVLVQKVGDPPAAAEGAGTASGATPGAASTGPLNLNTATLDQLDGLPGIGPVLAAAILAERVRRGAFKSVNELREVRGIGEQRFADLRELVAV